jgi:hypothetical protein
MTDLLHRLDEFSDRISPIVVKEVRQFVRGREFLASFAISLTVALLIAFFGSTQAMAGSRTTGVWTFSTLTACLALLGLAVVPMGAFTTLRSERLEQTLDLISLTTMSSRRIIVGKLGAQAVKLVTFFAVMAPFVATSFLLGGIDFVTIITAMFTVFLGSMWVAAAALFASTLFRSRLMSGLAFGVIAVVVLVLFSATRLLYYGLVVMGAPGYSAARAAAPGASQWWTFGTLVVFALMTMTNLVLLAESRLALATENRVSVLRVGFFAQFLLILAWALTGLFRGTYAKVEGLEALTFVGALHLAVVAAFAVTEGLTAQHPRVASPRWLRRWRWLEFVLGPGGNRAAVYVLLQMVMFVAAGAALGASVDEVRLLIAICGAICLLTGVPALFVHRFAKAGLGPIHARGLTLMLILMSLVLPDLLYYLLWRPEVFSISFSARHLLSPVLPVFNWNEVQANQWELGPLLWAAVGAMSYLWMLRVARRDSTPAEQVTTLGIATEADSRDNRSQ